jgi:extracellular solute-binding protein
MGLRRRSVLSAALAALVPALSGRRASGAPADSSADVAAAGARVISWPIFTTAPADLPAFNGHTDTVPDIVGRIGGANDLVIFTEGNHFPALLGGDVLDPFRRWAKADRRFADLALDEIAVVTLPQPIIVAALRQGGLKLGNAIIDISTKSRFYPDIVMGGAEPLRQLRGAGLVRAEARVFARHAGLALLVRAGNPLGVASLDDLLRPEVTIVIASASEPGARAQYRRALNALMGESAAADLFARETLTFEGRLGIQHRDVPEALAKTYANVGIIFSHLAQYYARTFPTLVEAIDVPGAEHFSSTIALAAASPPLRPRAAAAFEEFFLGVARGLYPRYGFATMAAEEFGQALHLDANDEGESGSSRAHRL